MLSSRCSKWAPGAFLACLVETPPGCAARTTRRSASAIRRRRRRLGRAHRLLPRKKSVRRAAGGGADAHATDATGEGSGLRRPRAVSRSVRQGRSGPMLRRDRTPGVDAGRRSSRISLAAGSRGSRVEASVSRCSSPGLRLSLSRRPQSRPRPSRRRPKPHRNAGRGSRAALPEPEIPRWAPRRSQPPGQNQRAQE